MDIARYETEQERYVAEAMGMLTEKVEPIIKVGTGVTEHLYTDTNPWEVIRVVSDKTLEIRKMKATIDPAYKPEFVAGGFHGCVVNQCEQKWIIEPDPDGAIMRIRKNNAGTWRYKGQLFDVGSARKFYDYNF